MTRSEISDELRNLILSVARRDDVHSVSCDFCDVRLWEGLLAEQMRRSKIIGNPPRESFLLCGPDGGIHGVAKDHPGLEDLPPEKRYTGKTLEERTGGNIHIPYEGVCGSDFLIYPEWRRISPEAWKQVRAELDWATPGKHCNHLLVNRDLGEAGCATVFGPVDGWWLYSSTAEYKDCNPFRARLRRP